MAIIKGKGAPTRNTSGSIGDIYVDVDNKVAYKCTFACKMPFSDPEYDWRKTDNIPVSYEEEKPVVDKKPEPEVSKEVEKTEETEGSEESVAVEESKLNYTNYSNKSRNNYNKQYTNYNK